VFTIASSIFVNCLEFMASGFSTNTGLFALIAAIAKSA